MTADQHRQLYNSADIYVSWIISYIIVFQMYFVIKHLLSHVDTLITSTCKNMINCNRRL